MAGDAEVQFAFANQTEHTYQAVLEKIVRGDYPPGEVFKVTRLARQSHANPVTTTCAAEWLCNDGPLVRLPRRGWQVLTLCPAEWKDLYQVREQLEVLAVKGVVDRMAEEKLDELEAEQALWPPGTRPCPWSYSRRILTSTAGWPPPRVAGSGRDAGAAPPQVVFAGGRRRPPGA